MQKKTGSIIVLLLIASFASAQPHLPFCEGNKHASGNNMGDCFGYCAGIAGGKQEVMFVIPTPYFLALYLLTILIIIVVHLYLGSKTVILFILVIMLCMWLMP